MPHNLDLILTLTGGLAFALVLGFVSQKLRLSPIVGYLLAGMAVGPYTPGFRADGGIAEQFAELGVILLMFGVGLHFHVDELLAVRRVAIPGAIVQIAIATALGALVTSLVGWSLTSGIIFGLAISVASTVVLLRVLADNEDLHTPAGHIAVGWLIVEDLFTVLALVMLPVIVGRDADAAGGSAALSIGLAVLKVVALVAVTLLAGKHLVPRLLQAVASLRSRELFTLTVLTIALGIAVGSAKLFGASMALGAFLAGMVVGQSEFSTRAASEALPMRDAFAVLFFVSMGMLLDPAAILPNLGLVLGTLAVVLVGKPIAAIVVVLVLKHPPKTAMTVAIALAQIGEFSFILAALGRSLGALPESATQALVATAIVSITLNPILYKLVDRLAAWLPAPRAVVDGGDGAPLPADLDEVAYRAIVVGHGPVGRALVEVLEELGVHTTVIDLNHETVRALRDRGRAAVYGDATQQEVLEAAGVRQAGTLLLTAPGNADAIARQALALNPALEVMARATYLSEATQLEAAGARFVVSAEGELAVGMADRLLSKLGASGDQLDRARDRVRAELAVARPRAA
jgi:CPA2 family monovalent cation:H+ antiporter-2